MCNSDSHVKKPLVSDAAGGRRTWTLDRGLFVVAAALFAAIQARPAVPPALPCQDIALLEAQPTRDRMTLRTLRAEWAVGKKLADEAERSATIIVDPTATQYLNRIEQRLTRKAGLKGCFTVKVIQDVEPNAYSLPGGFLYITSRLILMVNTESELAAALAHETAHVSARHFTRINRRRHLWGRLILIGGPAGYFVRRSLGPVLTMKAARNSEFEADRLGFRYLSASGYDPSALRRLLLSSFQDEEKPGSFFERLADSHPLTMTRMKRLDEMAHRSIPVRSSVVVDTSEFKNVRARISMLTNPAPNEDGRLIPAAE